MVVNKGDGERAEGAINEGAHYCGQPHPFRYTHIDRSINIGNTVDIEQATSKKKGKKKEEEEGRVPLRVILGVAAIALFEFAILWVAGRRYLDDRALYADLEADRQAADGPNMNGLLEGTLKTTASDYQHALKTEIESCQSFVAIRLRQDKLFLACGAVGTALMLAVVADQLWKRNIWCYRIWSTAIIVQPILGFATYMSGPNRMQVNTMKTEVLEGGYEYRRGENIELPNNTSRHEYLTNPELHDNQAQE